MASGNGKHVNLPVRAGRLIPQPKLPGPMKDGAIYNVGSSPGELFSTLTDTDVVVALKTIIHTDVNLNITNTSSVSADLALVVTRAIAICTDISIVIAHAISPNDEDNDTYSQTIQDPTLEFLGKGLKFPFAFQRRSGGTQISVATSSDHAHIHESIRQILGTKKGERFLRPEFGTRLHELIFEPNDIVLYGLIRHEVMTALDEWEPRVIVTDVRVGPGDSEHQVLVDISYRIISSQVEGNIVYPFTRELE